MSIKIGQASLGETGGRNQQPGNQTGRELNISNWYNGRWLGVLRYKSRKKAERAAQTCEAAIKNRNIGYDMDNRNTAYEAARAVGWDVSRIAKPVETDCSALMMLCAVAAGCASVEALYRRQGNSCTTYCMLHDWPATGDFVLLTGSKYLTTDANLLRGDVLVSEGHTVMALEDGKNAEEETEMVEKSKIIVDGKEVAVERILKNGTNYVKVRDIAAALDLEVGNKGNIAVLKHKEKQGGGAYVAAGAGQAAARAGQADQKGYGGRNLSGQSWPGK